MLVPGTILGHEGESPPAVEPKPASLQPLPTGSVFCLWNNPDWVWASSSDLASQFADS